MTGGREIKIGIEREWRFGGITKGHSGVGGRHAIAGKLINLRAFNSNCASRPVRYAMVQRSTHIPSGRVEACEQCRGSALFRRCLFKAWRIIACERRRPHFLGFGRGSDYSLAYRYLHRYHFNMAQGPRLSHTTAIILQALGTGHVYGYTVMEVTGLPSGTVYPALRRLERERLIRSQWERQSIADAALRPPRKYYRLTRSGEEALETSRNRYPLVAKLVSKEEV